jgi:hypothetical protein
MDNPHFKVQNIPCKVHSGLVRCKRMFITAFMIGGIYSIYTRVHSSSAIRIHLITVCIHVNDSCPMRYGASY